MSQSNNYALPAPLLALLSQYLQEHVTPTIEIDPSQLAYRWVGGRTGHLQPLSVGDQYVHRPSDTQAGLGIAGSVDVLVTYSLCLSIYF